MTTINLTGILLLLAVLLTVLFCFCLLLLNPRKYVLGFQKHDSIKKLSPIEENKFEINNIYYKG